MAHPMQEHRSHKHQKDRVSHIAGHAMGGGSGGGHSDVKEDKALIKKMVKGHALRADGGAVNARADKVARAKGGRVKGTTVNVIVSPKDQSAAPPMAAPLPMPPRPPVMPPAPVQAGPTPGLGGMPPPPIRSDGGRAYKRGGGVKGKMSGEKKHGKHEKPHKMRWRGGNISDSSDGGTPIQHSGNKSDTVNIGRKKPVTYATGGAIYPDYRPGHQMSWNKPEMGNGGGGGKERMAAAKRRKAAGHEPWTNDPGTAGGR